VLSRIAFALVAVFALVLAGAAFAAKPSGSSSITGPYLVTTSPTGSPVTAASTTTPQFGDTVTFDVSTTQTGNPFVHLNCYGNGIGYDSWAAFWPTAGTFVLSSPAWTSGAADCTAYLVMYVNSSRYKVLASTSFHVNA
jgi:hypothetical protein